MNFITKLEAILADNRLGLAKKLWKIQHGRPISDDISEDRQYKLKHFDSEGKYIQPEWNDEDDHSQLVINVSNDILRFIDRLNDEVSTISPYQMRKIQSIIATLQQKMEHYKIKTREAKEKYLKVARVIAADYYNKKYNLHLQGDYLGDDCADGFSNDVIEVCRYSRIADGEFKEKWNNGEFDGISEWKRQQWLEDKIEEETKADTAEIGKLCAADAKCAKLYDGLTAMWIEVERAYTMIEKIKESKVDVVRKTRFNLQDLSHIYDQMFGNTQRMILTDIIDPESITEDMFNTAFEHVLMFYLRNDYNFDKDYYKDYYRVQRNIENNNKKPEDDYYNSEFVVLSNRIDHNNDESVQVPVVDIFNYFIKNYDEEMTNLNLDTAKAMLKLYKNRDKNNKDKYCIVLSRAANDIAALTQRKNQDPRRDIDFSGGLQIINDIQNACLIGYLCKINDYTSMTDSSGKKYKNKKINIQQPLGQIRIIPFIPLSEDYHDKDRQEINVNNVNWVLVCDKPYGAMPHDVVHKIQQYLNEKWNKSHINMDIEYYRAADKTNLNWTKRVHPSDIMNDKLW